MVLSFRNFIGRTEQEEGVLALKIQKYGEKREGDRGKGGEREKAFGQKQRNFEEAHFIM